ncbi:hypothetical protein CKO37_11670 [Rubrivivax gelatinosus]|nr:hypothetical protein [Rubrivivax gelatinosus]
MHAKASLKSAAMRSGAWSAITRAASSSRQSSRSSAGMAAMPLSASANAVAEYSVHTVPAS